MLAIKAREAEFDAQYSHKRHAQLYAPIILAQRKWGKRGLRPTKRLPTHLTPGCHAIGSILLKLTEEAIIV